MTRFAFAFAFAFALTACGSPAEEEPSLRCPAAGPCTETQIPEDCGKCDPTIAYWIPCTTLNDDGACDLDSGVFVYTPKCTPCGECAAAAVAVDPANVLTCLALPNPDYIVSDAQ
jgi:hypothetical protein